MDSQLYRYSFTDTSSNSPTSWLWDFGDGATSKDQNPTHTYSTPGTYTVTLTASNSAGSDDEVKTNFITVVVPVIDLTVSDMVGPENPVAGGTYQVNVTVTNNGTIDMGTFTVKLYDNTAQKQKIVLSGPGLGESTTAIFIDGNENTYDHYPKTNAKLCKDIFFASTFICHARLQVEILRNLKIWDLYNSTGKGKATIIFGIVLTRHKLRRIFSFSQVILPRRLIFLSSFFILLT